MTNTHEGLTRIGVTYHCTKCAALAELKAAMRRNDWQLVRLISETGPSKHAADCIVTAQPMFEIFA